MRSIVLAVVLGITPACLFAQVYQITDLNAPTDTYRLAYALNAAGDVVGEYEPADILFVRSFCFNHGTNTDLGMLAGYVDAYAHAIDDSNQVAGWCDNYAGSERAFLWANGSMQNLGTLSPFPTGGWSRGYGINRSGYVVGAATLTDNTTYHAVLYNGTKKDLGSLGGATYNSTAYGINNSGVVVGESEVAGSTYTHAFVWNNNVMTDLQTLPGGAYSHASAINSNGVIVGESQVLTDSGVHIHAFRCASGVAGMSDLGTLGGYESSAAAINSAAQIVGYALDSNSISRAFVYDGTHMLDLNSMIPPGSGWDNLEAATGINDSGQIAGYGKIAGVYHSFLLTPSGPLTVSITNPARNATFTAPAAFLVQASVWDVAGTATNVQFLLNGSAFANATSSPFSANATNLAAGNYTLTAVAADDAGFRATNSIQITVRAAVAPVTISDAAFNAGSFSFTFGTQSGHTYAAQFTTPLSATNNWITFTNVIGNDATARVTDTNAFDAERYYRVVTQ